MANLAQFKLQNKFLMLALDHRDSIKKKFTSDEELVNFKAKIIDSLQDQFSGVLIDVKYGLPAYKNRNKPFLLPAEKSGYQEVDGERITQLEYSANELKKLGAGGVKLLLNFKPDGKTANQQLELAKEVGQDSAKENLPFFLEIVTYGNKQNSVVRSVEIFLQNNIRPDVFKLEFPGDEESCKKITEKLGEIPWILLTGGEDFELFKSQLKEAIKNGCSGFLAGRALWKDLLQLQQTEKEKFLKEILPNRFSQISQIVTQTS